MIPNRIAVSPLLCQKKRGGFPLFCLLIGNFVQNAHGFLWKITRKGVAKFKKIEYNMGRPADCLYPEDFPGAGPGEAVQGLGGETEGNEARAPLQDQNVRISERDFNLGKDLL